MFDGWVSNSQNARRQLNWCQAVLFLVAQVLLWSARHHQTQDFGMVVERKQKISRWHEVMKLILVLVKFQSFTSAFGNRHLALSLVLKQYPIETNAQRKTKHNVVHKTGNVNVFEYLDKSLAGRYWTEAVKHFDYEYWCHLRQNWNKHLRQNWARSLWEQDGWEGKSHGTG